MDEIKIDDKYTIKYDDTDWLFKAYRYGEEWRDLVGDNLILAMFYRIKELEGKLK